MIPLRCFLLACAGGLLIAPVAAMAVQAQEQPQTPPTAEESPAPQPEGDSAGSKPEGEEARICRAVRADPSSRRKTKVCRTAEEWRKLNVPL